MHKRKQLIAIFCLLTISAIIAPKEFYHSLEGHKDSIDIIQKGQSSQFGKIHQHCDILNFETPVYHSQVKIFLLSIPFLATRYLDIPLSHYTFDSYSLSFSRAPPF
jgi:hypothetical protein